VVWYFLRSVEFPVSICEQIIACVTSDVDVQNAIAQMLSTNQIFNQYLTTTTRAITGGNLTGKLISGECDNGIVAGRVKAIVDAMDQANRDWFEKIEVGTNDEEKFALALEAIPVLGELPFDQIIEFLEDILEDFTENYAAQVDAELLDEWYCGLYCIAKSKPDCSLTYGDIYNFFADRTSSNLTPFSALFDVVSFIRSGDFSGGTKVADGMMMLQSGLTVNGRDFMGSSLPTLSFATRDAVSSSFWEDCEDCPETELWLKIIMGPDESLEFISETTDTQTWKMTNYFTGNYLTGGALSADGSGFFILDVIFNPATTGNDARFVFPGVGTYELDNVPCDVATSQLWIYNALAGSEVTIVISREGCFDVWEIAYYGEILSQTSTTVTGRGLLTPDSGGLYQLELQVVAGACVTVSGGTATSSSFDYNFYQACGEGDSIEFTMAGSSMPSLPGTVQFVAFSSASPFDVTVNYTS